MLYTFGKRVSLFDYVSDGGALAGKRRSNVVSGRSE